MDQNALYNPPPPVGQNENNLLVTCPYCNQTMKEDILNDHLLGHELENEDNLNSKNDLNNQNQNYDSSHYGPDRRYNNIPNSEPRYFGFNNNRPNNPSNNSNNQNNNNNNFLSTLFSSIFNVSSDNQNNNSSQVNNNNNNNGNNSGNNENNPGFFNSLFGINPNRNNNGPQNNNSNNNNNNNANNNNPQSVDDNNIIEGISNTIGEIGKNLSSRLLNSLRTNQVIRSSLLDQNPLRIMRMNDPQYQNNSHYDYTQHINQIYVPESSFNHQIVIMRPPIMMAQPGQILIPGEDLRSNLSDDELNRIMGCLPSSVVNEKNEGENNNCVICLGDFEPGDSVTTLPCVHMFHTECIKTWFKSNNHCPVCKFEITLNSLMRGN